MAHVPEVYVKDKAVNYEREIFAIMGEGVRVGGWHFRPPSLGVWALWEILDSPIIKGEDATQGDYLRMLWVNDVRRDAVEEVALWVDVGKPKPGEFCELDIAVLAWAEDVQLPEEALTDAVRDEVLEQMPLCFTGYETIPGKNDGGTTGPWLFAGESFGAICGTDAAAADRLIWDTPMTLHGHVTANRAACAGAKGIARPKDEEHVKAMLAESNEREKRGELHPWQIKDPVGCVGTPLALSAEQGKHPECLEKFERLLAAAKDK